MQYVVFSVNNIVRYLVELCLCFPLTVSCHMQQQGLDSRGQSQHGLRTGDQVKGHRERPPLLKVGEPEFGPSKLPFNISIILKTRGKQNQMDR